MARVRKLPEDQRRLLREQVHQAVEKGGASWSKSIRNMRLALGLSQAQFAIAFRLTKNQVAGFEAGTANPTVETLERIGRPFGYRIGFISKTAQQATLSAVGSEDNPQTRTEENLHEL